MTFNSRLAELMSLATDRWQKRVTIHSIARATNIDDRSLRRFHKATPERLYIGVLRGICWYFQCQPSSLLVLPQADTPLKFERMTAPETGVSGEIVSEISQKIARFRTNFLAESLHCSRSAVSRLREQTFAAIDPDTLVALCHVLEVETIDQLLNYAPGLEVHAGNLPVDQIAVIQAKRSIIV